MTLKVCAWLTLGLVVSVLFVYVGSLLGWLPALADIGRSPAGVGLLLFWMVSLLGMLAHVAALLVLMARARHWGWFVSSFVLAPITTLYYFWFVRSQ